MTARDYRQSPDSRTHLRCDVCGVDGVVRPELVTAWLQEHAHEEGHGE